MAAEKPSESSSAKEMNIAENDTLVCAPQHYRDIINMADHRDLKQGVKNQFRESASALLKIITKQIAQIAELNGRLLEREEIATVPPTTNKVPSYSGIVMSKESKCQNRETKKKFSTTIKPLEKNTTSLKTKEQVQAKIDVRKIKISIKKVRNIKEGGILIETVSVKDQDKLIQHFKEQDELKEKFNINKPTARKPPLFALTSHQTLKRRRF
ncbi:hypothetical protein CDAR_276631 [Caerostris darwini]|uniref:Uncharacterized protein n=1 Tax=Caerostris darwini TaxID=1538125 RepID=A0AAV4N193_9ARAC|nr:hypothetical protein CDAR_276631 [Caerostris darwini]